MISHNLPLHSQFPIPIQHWLVGLNLGQLGNTSPPVFMPLAPLAILLTHLSASHFAEDVSVTSQLCGQKRAEKEQWEQKSDQAALKCPNLVSLLLLPCPGAGGHCDTRGTRRAALSWAVSRPLSPTPLCLSWGLWERNMSMWLHGHPRASLPQLLTVHGVVLPLKHPQPPTSLSPGRNSFFHLAE